MRALALKQRLRRGLAFLVASVVLAAFAVAEVERRTRAADEIAGPRLPLVRAVRDLPPGSRLRPSDVAVVGVPASFAPPSAFSDPRLVIGRRLRAPLLRGDPVTVAVFASQQSARGGRSLAPGQRLLELPVAGGSALDSVAAGARVDVLVSVEGGVDGGRTEVAVENAELAALRPLAAAAGDGELGERSTASASDDGAGARATHLATLVVSTRAAVSLTAAAVFAREVRLLVRPDSDERPVGPLAAGPGG